MHFYIPCLAEKGRSVIKRLNFGFHCVICGRSAQQSIDICRSCEGLFVPRVRQSTDKTFSILCLICGDEKTVFSGRFQSRENLVRKKFLLEQGCCSKCQTTCNIFSRIVAPYRYEFPLDKFIAQMKYAGRQKYGRVLGELLAVHVKSMPALPDVLIPVPLHRTRLAERGYNQAADIANWCAKTIGVKSQTDLVTRQVETGSLAGAGRAHRQLQILGAFRASEKVRGLRVAIVDDVLTTGSTAREMARELYDTGASSVELWVLARTSSDR